MIEILQGDCLELMGDIPDGSIDMILCDLPYGTTNCRWDSVIPFEPLWAHYKRVIKRNGAVVLTASQPFTTALIVSNPDWFKYALVWEKSRSTGHVHAKNKPMKKHEDILVFSFGSTVHKRQSERRMTYNPQGLRPCKPRIHAGSSSSDAVMAVRPSHRDTVQTISGYPHSILRFNSESNCVHPTQKPVALFEYLIRTYTNPGELVLDNAAGSGTTGVAALNSGRRAILIEREPEYVEIAKRRLGLTKARSAA